MFMVEFSMGLGTVSSFTAITLFLTSHIHSPQHFAQRHQSIQTRKCSQCHCDTMVRSTSGYALLKWAHGCYCFIALFTANEQAQHPSKVSVLV